ncbi:MAG: hypothetical protein IJ714_06105 [Bacteroidales bacterium]|nr:hypothetical protein [Bacteroidales bacterium]
MKRIGAVLLMLGMSLALNAQRPIYLFKEFTQGSVALKNRTFVKTTFNYDTLHDKLLYMDGDQIMELSDYSNVQSVFIGERMFIPQGKSLYEVVDLGESPSKLLIRWHQKKNPLGKKGAYDQVTHASNAVSIDPEYYSVSLKERGGEEVFDTIVENSYGILTQGKFKKFTDRRSFLKQFSGHKTEIENYIDGNHLLFNRPDDVIAIARYAVQL